MEISELINRYCRVVGEINSINDYLEECKSRFYCGGHSFESVYKSNFDELAELHKEFIELHKSLNTPQ